MANFITIVGTMAADPELRFTPSGVAVTSVSIACNKRRKAANGEWEDAGTDWYKATAWRDLAQNVAESLEKGTRVVVMGRLEFQEWEDKEGNPRTTPTITADEWSPSLKWATCEVEKTERSEQSSSSRGSERQTGNPWAGPASNPAESPF